MAVEDMETRLYVWGVVMMIEGGWEGGWGPACLEGIKAVVVLAKTVCLYRGVYSLAYGDR